MSFANNAPDVVTGNLRTEDLLNHLDTLLNLCQRSKVNFTLIEAGRPVAKLLSMSEYANLRVRAGL